MLAIIILLLVAIRVYAGVVKASAYHRVEMEKKKREEQQFPLKGILLLIAASSVTHVLHAIPHADGKIIPSVPGYYGLGATTFYLMLGAILIELAVIRILHNISNDLLGENERRQKLVQQTVAKAKAPRNIIERLNASVALEEETDIMLDHDYDGIRELDNNLPPWWKYGFYISIAWAVGYLFVYHVSGTGKLQEAEYTEQLAIAQEEAEEYRKRSANLVDETNAFMLTDMASLENGKNVYMENCVACHGRLGEGGVGPNLTDDYWLHKGSIRDIFKTIKYGWPEKGMKSWKQDLGARQIHELSSYIKSMAGSQPANAKPHEGELYKEEMIADSTMKAATSEIQ